MLRARYDAAVLAVAAGALLVAPVAQAQTISKTAMAGTYSVTLKVLPAESFSGPKAEMTWDGGAKANAINGPAHPNHHLVVFVEKDGKPVESATVTIEYRRASSKPAAWTALPVARMHVAGKGAETTHFGNNLRLAAGSYEARVSVDGSPNAVFSFSLSK
jgi:hypothetical protein